MHSGNDGSSRSEEYDLRFLLYSMTPNERPLCRDVLASVLPAFQRHCAEHGAHATHVDPQAGIVDGAAHPVEVVRRTFDELDRGAFLVGIIGSRYGPAFAADAPGLPDLRQRSPWLEQAIRQGASPGDVVMREGVLRKPISMSGRAAFFLQRGGADAGQTREQRLQLVALKRALRTNGVPVREFDTAGDLGPMVAECLCRWCDRRLPSHELGARAGRERLVHEAFRNSYCVNYLREPRTIHALDDFVQGDRGGVCWVYGQSGNGKTSLLVNWVREFRANNPDVFLIEHYVDAMPSRRSLIGFMRRVLPELKERFDIAAAVPPRAQEIREAYNAWLANERKERIVLVVDGIDKFEGIGDLNDVLPAVIAPHVRIIVSAGQQPDAVSERFATGASAIFVPGLSVKQRQELALRDVRGRSPLSEPRPFARRIANISAAQGTFHSKLVGRVLADPDLAEADRIALLERYERAERPDELVDQIIGDLAARCTGLPVRPFLVAIWASQGGLTAGELAAVCGAKGVPSVERASRLLAVFDPCLAGHEERYSFKHDHITHAVQRRFVKRKDAAQAAHQALADLLLMMGPDPRRTYELLWQLRSAGDMERMYRELCRLETLRLFQEDGREYELLTSWSARSSEELQRCYLASLERAVGEGMRDAAGYQQAHASVGAFLLLAGRFDAAVAVLETERRFLRSSNEQASLLYAVCMTRLGEAELARGNYAAAGRALRTALEVQRRLGRSKTIEHAESLERLAGVLNAQHRGHDALKLLNTADDILRTMLHGLDERCLRNAADRGAVLYECEEYEAAEDILRSTLVQCEKTLGTFHTQTLEVLNSLGAVYERQAMLAAPRRIDGTRRNGAAQSDANWLAEARDCRERALAISERLFPPGHPDITARMSNLGMQCRMEADYAGAEALYRSALAHDEGTFDATHPRIAGLLINLAMVLRMQGGSEREEQALEYLLRTRTIRKRRRDTPRSDIADVELSLASLLKLMRRHRRSLKYYRLGLPTRVVWLGLPHQRTRDALGGLADLMVKMGRSYAAACARHSSRSGGLVDIRLHHDAVIARSPALALAARHAAACELGTARRLCREVIAGHAKAGDATAPELIAALELLAAVTIPPKP